MRAAPVLHSVRRSGSALLPTSFGEFTITVYCDSEGKEHLAILKGDLQGPPPLVRIHSECLTGDVFGSVRCDCGEQLHTALRYISREGRGLLLYLRQEGRGIGLNNKILAYALQDEGMDTVEANLHLGFPADSRSYIHAAAMLKDLGVESVRLATNNPEKVKALQAAGIAVAERVSYAIPPRPENLAYLRTKAAKMGHLFASMAHPQQAPENTSMFKSAGIVTRVRERLQQREGWRGLDGEAYPTVTLSYAQSLDGSIAATPGKPLQLSNPQSQALTHRLRSLHDAVLIGINTLLSDDPKLTVRLVSGKSPQPVVLDGRLRLPLTARLLHPPSVPPIIATTERASGLRERRLQKAGARVVRLPSAQGSVDLRSLLRYLYDQGIRSVMVEGGAEVITAFLTSNLVDQVVITIAPQMVGGLNAIRPSRDRQPAALGALTNVEYETFAGDLAMYAEMAKAAERP